MQVVLLTAQMSEEQIGKICGLLHDNIVDELEKGRRFVKGEFQVTVEAIRTIRSSSDRQIRVLALDKVQETGLTALENALIRTHKQLGAAFGFTFKEPADGTLLLGALMK